MNITIGNPWAVSEKGGRLNNEDSIFPLPETANSNQNLFLVCDGVGGAEKGEIASSLACESFQTFFSTFREGEPNADFINKAIRYTEARFDDYVAKLSGTLQLYERNRPCYTGRSIRMRMSVYHVNTVMSGLPKMAVLSNVKMVCSISIMLMACW